MPMYKKKEKKKPYLYALCHPFKSNIKCVNL